MNGGDPKQQIMAALMNSRPKPQAWQPPSPQQMAQQAMANVQSPNHGMQVPSWQPPNPAQMAQTMMSKPMNLAGMGMQPQAWQPPTVGEPQQGQSTPQASQPLMQTRPKQPTGNFGGGLLSGMFGRGR